MGKKLAVSAIALAIALGSAPLMAQESLEAAAKTVEAAATLADDHVLISPWAGPPASPVILGMVLGKLMEEKMRQSLVISDGSMMIFLTRPISLFLLLLAVVSITNPYWKQIAVGVRRLLGRPLSA